MSLRANETLLHVDALICEEYKNGSKILKKIGVSKPLHLLNEHSSPTAIEELFHDLFIKTSGCYALVSDAGTPCFADPGAELVKLCYANNIPVSAVPGASSLMAALMLCGKRMDRFWYYGFLPANKDARRIELNKIRNVKDMDIFILDAPYRLKALLEDLCLVMGSSRKARLFYKLTYPEEKVYLGTLGSLNTLASSIGKGEFVLLLEANQ